MANVGFSSIEELSNVVVTEFQVRFAEAINSAENLGNVLSTEVVTKTEAAEIAFINSWTTLTGYEINEAPEYKTMVGAKFQQAIKKYAKGIEISKTTWSDPSSQSLLMSQLDALVAEAAMIRSRRISYSLKNGDSTVTSYDGQNLFSNTHSLNGSTFDNLIGEALTPSGFNAAKNILRTVPLGDDGTYLPTYNATFHLVVPPQLESAAKLILNSQTIYEDNKFATNPYLMDAQLHVDSLLTDSNDWYLLMTLPSLKPFVSVRHVDSNAALIPRIAETDPNVIERNMFLWNLQLLEETVSVHYYQMVKSVQS